MKGKLIGCLCFVLFATVMHVKAGKRSTFNAGALAAGSDNDIGYGLTLNYNLWLNNHVCVYFGGMFTHFKSDNGADWQGKSGGKWRWPDPLEVRHLNADAGILVFTPSVLKTGLYGGAHVLADVFPFNIVSLKKVEYSEQNFESTRDYGRFRFNYFSPGAFAEAGVYHDFRAFRLSLGFGYGCYDPFSTYRHAVIDGVRIGGKMNSQDHLFQQLTLRLTVF